MSGKKIKGSYISSIFLLVIILLFIVSSILIILIPKQYEEYSNNYVEEVKRQIGEVVKSEDVALKITELKNEYSFDTMLFDQGVLIHTSEDLIYDIEYADAIYNDGYIYRGSYVVDDVLVWIIVYESDLSDFINYTLMRNLVLFAVQALLMIVLLVIMLRKVLKPLSKLSEIIYALKSNNNMESNEELDEISEELVRVANELKLKLYYSRQEENEYERMYLKHVDLLEEQKQHLSHIVHDVKGTFSAINFSSHALSNIKDLSTSEKLALDSIETSSSSALNYITQSLNQIINNSVDIYITKDEVEVKQKIEKFFEFNSMLLLEKSLNVSISGAERTIVINVLKFDQIITNLLSNMIKHSKEGTELIIKLQNDKCIFTNAIGNAPKEYSNSFGLNSIKDLAKSIGLKYEYKFKNNVAEFVLYLGDD